MAAIAEWPFGEARITNVLPKNADNENAAGAYRVKFMVNGDWHYVNVDDGFPTYGSGIPWDARFSDAGAYWQNIIEKAWAKTHVNYDRLHAGLPFVALRSMTGFPTMHFKPKNMGTMEIWNKLTLLNN